MNEQLPTEQVARLRERYAARLAETAEELARLADAGADEEIVNVVHRLRGSAASFGFPAVTELSASVEDAWTQHQDHIALREGARALKNLLSSCSTRELGSDGPS